MSLLDLSVIRMLSVMVTIFVLGTAFEQLDLKLERIGSLLSSRLNSNEYKEYLEEYLLIYIILYICNYIIYYYHHVIVDPHCNSATTAIVMK